MLFRLIASIVYGRIRPTTVSAVDGERIVLRLVLLVHVVAQRLLRILVPQVPASTAIVMRQICRPW